MRQALDHDILGLELHLFLHLESLGLRGIVRHGVEIEHAVERFDLGQRAGRGRRSGGGWGGRRGRGRGRGRAIGYVLHDEIALRRGPRRRGRGCPPRRTGGDRSRPHRLRHAGRARRGGGGGRGSLGNELDHGLSGPGPTWRCRRRRLLRRLALRPAQHLGGIPVHGIGRQQPRQPVDRFVVAAAAQRDLAQDLERQHVLGVQGQHLPEHVGRTGVVLLIHHAAPEDDVGADVVGVSLETSGAQLDRPI